MRTKIALVAIVATSVTGCSMLYNQSECQSLQNANYCYENITISQFHHMVETAGTPDNVQYVLLRSIERDVHDLTTGDILEDVQAHPTLTPDGYRITATVGDEKQPPVTVHFQRIK